MSTAIVARYIRSHCLGVLFPCKYRFSLQVNYKAFKRKKQFHINIPEQKLCLHGITKCCIEIETLLQS